MKRNASSQPTESGYVEVGPLATDYDVIGDGPPVLLLHGGLTTAAATFHVVRPALARRFRTIVVEQQGHGHTVDVDRELTFTRMAEVLIRFLSARD